MNFSISAVIVETYLTQKKCIVYLPLDCEELAGIPVSFDVVSGSTGGGPLKNI